MSDAGTKDFETARNAIRSRGSARIYGSVNAVRSSARVGTFRPLVAWLGSAYAIPQLPTRSRPAFRSLNVPYLFDAVDLDREMRWAAAVAISNVPLLSRFLALARRFDIAFLRDAQEEVSSLLSQVEAECGFSLWLVNAQIMALQAYRGLDAQKSQVLRWIDEVENGSPIAFVAHYLSVRNEPRVNVPRFLGDLDRRVQQFDLSEELTSFLRYVLVFPHAVETVGVGHVLRRLSATSIPDAYEALVVACRASLLAGRERDAIPDVVRQLRARLDDRRLDPLLWLSGEGEWPCSEGDVQLAGSFAQRDYATALATALSILSDHPTSANAAHVAIRSAAMIERADAFQSLPSRLATYLRTAAGLMMRNHPTAEETSDLRRYVLGFAGTPLAATLNAFSEDAVRSFPTPRLDRSASTAALLAEGPFPPRLGELDALVLQRHVRLFGEPTFDTSNPEGALAAARRAFASSQDADVLKLAEPHIGNPVRAISRDAARLVSNVYLRQGNLEKAANLVVSHCLTDRHSHSVLPIADVSRACSKPSPSLQKEIALPILLELYFQHVDADLESDLVFAFHDFLLAHQLSRPADLVKAFGSPAAASTVYFLKYVCIESVMDRSGFFETSDAVVQARLDVCRALMELDASSAATYQVEIRSLLRRLKIEQRTRQVEQSKIYVDVEGLKRVLSDELRESFNRYQALSEGRASADPQDIAEALRKFVGGDLADLARLRVPRNEAMEIFTSLVVRLRDEFTENAEHGLNKYLSVRVRHGTLAAHLRRCVEAHRLVTRRGPNSTEYTRNSYWLEGFSANDWREKRVDALLTEFSKSYDELVERIKARLQITSASREGLFDFTITQPGIVLVATRLGVTTTFDEFFTIIMANLEEILILRLEAVRKYINEDARRAALELIDHLHNEVAKLSNSGDLGPLLHACKTASTELKVEFDRLAGWFVRSEDTTHEPFAIDDAIQIASQTVQASVREFGVTLAESAGEGILQSGRYLTFVVDVFFVLFDNVARHSGLAIPHATVSITSLDGSVHLRVSNELAPHVDRDRLAQRMAEIELSLKRAEAEQISREGGTGLHKLRTLLAHDIGTDSGLAFGLGPAGEYFVEFDLPQMEDANEGAASRG